MFPKLISVINVAIATMGCAFLYLDPTAHIDMAMQKCSDVNHSDKGNYRGRLYESDISSNRTKPIGVSG